MFTLINRFVFYNLPILWRQYTHNRDVANHKPPKYSEQYRGSCFAWNEVVAKYFLVPAEKKNVQKKGSTVDAPCSTTTVVNILLYKRTCKFKKCIYHSKCRALSIIRQPIISSKKNFRKIFKAIFLLIIISDRG